MALPLFFSLRLSLYNWNGIGPKIYVGFGNFVKLFTESYWNTQLWNVIVNNIKFFIYFNLFQNVPALILAWLIFLNLKGSVFFRNLFFIPVTMSIIMVGFVGTLLLNPIWGPFNNLMKAIGLDFMNRPWLGDPKTALVAIAIIGSWQYIGIPIVLFLSAMENIPDELIEAAHIDGATDLGVFRYILVPLLAPVFGIVVVLTFVGNFTGFEFVYAMEGPMAGPSYATDIFGTFFYRTAFGSTASPQVGLGAAIAVCMFIIISLMIFAWLRYNHWYQQKLGI